MEIAGVHFDSVDALRRATRQQLTGTPVWTDRDDYHPVDGLIRAIHHAGLQRATVGEAVTDLLTHDDLKVRTGAVRALEALGKAVPADRLVQILQEQPDKLIGVEAEGYRLPEPLDGPVLRALARGTHPGDKTAVRLLREGARRGRWVHQQLAELDPDGTVADATDLIPRNFVFAALRGLPDAARRRALAKELGPWPEEERAAALEHPGWGLLDLPDDEQQELQNLISGRA